MERVPLASHPIAEIMPNLPEWEYESLRDSIRDTGLKDNILVFEEKTLDGRHREKACISLDIEPRYETFQGTHDEAVERVMSKIHCRQLSKSQRAMILSNLVAAKIGRPKNQTPNVRLPATIEQVAEKGDMSRSILAKAKRVNDKSPALARAVVDNEISLNVAEKLVNSTPAAVDTILTKIREGVPVRDLVTPTKNGRPSTFEDRKLTDAIGKVVRLIDEKLSVSEKTAPDRANHKAMMEGVRAALGAWKQWKSN